MDDHLSTVQPDDDDDICPVCESECTCHNRTNPALSKTVLASYTLPSVSATSSQYPLQTRPQSQNLHPLKIKFTVPPNLKFRKNSAVVVSSAKAALGGTSCVRPPKKKKTRLSQASSSTPSPSLPAPNDREDHNFGNRWEIKPRKNSVGPEDIDIDTDSEETSGDEYGADDEDDGDDDSDGEPEADPEGGGPGETEDEPELNGHGKIGVSFGGVSTGWSEDEESSFDADLFFANLDDSSDSCSSPRPPHNDAFVSEANSDVDSVFSFSADEQDALLLMDVGHSIQVRRGSNEFEVGVDLGGLSFGWDGQLLPPPLNTFSSFDVDVFGSSTETDVDMTASDADSSTEDQLSRISDADGMALEETDGETTEDELVDSDGLPNPRAMMLFRWPPAVSAINPLSTMSPVSTSPARFPPNTSQTMRIALATISAQRGSPPTPADILAGKISMDDLDEIEITSDRHVDASRSDSGLYRQPQGAPVMGQFATGIFHPTEKHAVIDGKGGAAPSPFPRSRILHSKKRLTIAHNAASIRNLIRDTERSEPPSSRDTATHPVYARVPSSDEAGTSSFQPPTSEEPSSADAIDLDDVLDASFLSSDPMALESDVPSDQYWLAPRTSVGSLHHRSLDRWDRIPVATFRRTRETMADSTPVSDGGLGSRYNMGTLVNNDMLGTLKATGDKKSKTARKYARANSSTNMLVISPVLFPVREEDLTPTSGPSSIYNPFLPDPQTHQKKTRKEKRKEKVIIKRKMMGKHINLPPKQQQQHQHRHHYPNSKTRGSNSVQRTHFASSSNVPHLNL
ncbi:hypothetical protein PHLCEN_2v4894 [Hermanssonia centrifuga]|uniref:Uncharacterized protein n=1 Tax=Hermanssonia centrifuga TaxID=98765 RepID=A0A2R6PG44_9APHY|nr:hypothetical protein PHLCEN_2v4894 [Hermanssonia centrifuga]